MDQQIIQQATSHISPAPVKQELKPSERGAVQELSQALEGERVSHANKDDMLHVLKRIMLLVGIRAANLPTYEETGILIMFIQKKYSLLTLEEIQLAFEKAVAGELELDLDDVKCYENFSPEYFGRIMAAYKKWASQKWNENQMYLVKPQTTNLLTMPADFSELAEIYYQDYLKGNFNIRIMPVENYDSCVKGGYMHPEAYKRGIKTALTILRVDLKMEISQAYSESEKHELTEKLRKIENGEDEFKVIELAKKLAVEFLYKTAKGKNIKHLFVKV